MILLPAATPAAGTVTDSAAPLVLLDAVPMVFTKAMAAKAGCGALTGPKGNKTTMESSAVGSPSDNQARPRDEGIRILGHTWAAATGHGVYVTRVHDGT